MLKISEILTNRRKELNMTYETLSTLTGITTVSLCKYEKEKATPTVKNLGKLANALQLDYDELYNIIKENKK